MGIIKRQSLKTSIVNYIGVLIGVVFFNFVFPHLVSEEYLGLIGLLQNLTYIFISIPALGLAQIIFRYFSVWKESETVNYFNAFALLAMSVGIILFAFFYYLFRHQIIENYKAHSALFVPYYFLIIPLVATQVFSQYFEIYSMLKLRVAVPTFLREIVMRVLLILLIYGFIYHLLNQEQFIYGFALIYIVTFFILLIYAVKGLGFKAYSPNKFLTQNSDVKQQFYFGGGMLLLTVCLNISNFLDGIILPAYLGLGVLGIYMRPLVLGQMIQVPYRAISFISTPIIREAIVNNDMQKVNQLNKAISINLFLIGCFLYTLLVSNASGIFALLPPSYAIGENVLYIIATGRLVDMAFGLNTEIINSSKHFKYIIYLSVIMMLMTIVLNVLLIPRMGMNGAALAVSISLMVFNVLKSIVIYNKFHFHCFSKHYITLLCISACTMGILFFIPHLSYVEHHMFLNSCLNIVGKSILGAILFVVPVYYCKVSTDFNDFFQLIISGKIFKGGHKMEEL